MRSLAIQRQRGLSLIETAAVLGVASLFLAMFSTTMAENGETAKAKAAAEKMIEVQTAAESYIKAKKTDLMTNTSGGRTVSVAAGRIGTGSAPAGSLQAEGYLSPGFVDANGYGQRHAVIVRQITVAGQPMLDAVVSTYGGRAIPDRVLPKVAQFIGAAGGFVPASGPGVTPGAIIGTAGGWRSTMATWGTGTTAPRVGSIVATLAFSGTEATSDFLYRTTAGGAEGNRMHAAIDMNGNDLSAARNVGATGTVTAGGNVTAGGDVRGINVWSSGSVTAGSNVNAAGVVSAGAGVTTGGSVSAGGNVSANGAVSAQTGIYSNAGISASGSVTGQNVTATQRVAAANLQATEVATAGASCGTRGLQAVTSTGAPLFCISGTWRTAGGFQGRWQHLGRHLEEYTETNSTGGTIIVTAWEGGWPGYNTCHLQGSVNGTVVQLNADSNSDYWKQCSISFPVAPGQRWRVISTPYNIRGQGYFTVSYFY